MFKQYLISTRAKIAAALATLVIVFSFLSAVTKGLSSVTDFFEWAIWAYDKANTPWLGLMMLVLVGLLLWTGQRDIKEAAGKGREVDHRKLKEETEIRQKALDDIGARLSIIDTLVDFAASDYEYRLTAERVFAIRPKIQAALAWQPRAEFSRQRDGPAMEASLMFHDLNADAAWIGQDYPRPVFEAMPDPTITERELGLQPIRAYNPALNANFEAMLQTNKQILSDAHSKLEAILTDQEQRRNAELSKLRRIKGQERI